MCHTLSQDAAKCRCLCYACGGSLLGRPTIPDVPDIMVYGTRLCDADACAVMSGCNQTYEVGNLTSSNSNQGSFFLKEDFIIFKIVKSM
jgi:hypothetical protein